MNADKKAILSLIESYLYYCENYGYTDFTMWCEDNFDNVEQESIAFEIKEHIEAIAGLLFL